MVVRCVAGVAVLLLTGMLFARFTGVTTHDADSRRSEQINLALRRTAHHLLRASGDSTSRIPPVHQSDGQTFRVTLNRAFDYDRLPNLLRTSLQVHRITTPYDVAVLDCANGTLQLGYNVADLTRSEPVPCGGRSITAGCYVLQVTFAAPPQPTQSAPYGSILALAGLLVGFLYVVWGRPARPADVSVPSVPADAPTRLCFGRSSLDPDGQMLRCGPESHTLTYREAKLLRLFVNHPNQVLEREQILKQVWEDEGVTVGRSVDVFVSRLRKLLRVDTTVRITAVHGIGYRLDVQEDTDTA